MDTLPRTPVRTPDPSAARYFRLLAVHEAAEAEAARLGLPPVPFTA